MQNIFFGFLSMYPSLHFLSLFFTSEIENDTFLFVILAIGSTLLPDMFCKSLY